MTWLVCTSQLFGFQKYLEMDEDSGSLAESHALCQAQTNVACAGGNSFYLLEALETQEEEAINDELEET